MAHIHKATLLSNAMHSYIMVLRCIAPKVYPMLAAIYFIRKYAWVRISFITAKVGGATSHAIYPIKGHKHFKRSNTRTRYVLDYYTISSLVAHIP